MAVVTPSFARAIRGSSRVRFAARVVIGGGIVVALIARVGTGAFLHGLTSITPRSAVLALLLGAVSTAAMAWRWRVIAGRLGVGVPWRSAFALYYRSQFLNTVLPGGVLGDVNRAVVHGRLTDNIRVASRSVIVERVTGQLVQIGIAVAVLAGFGVEFEGYLLSSIGICLGIVVIGSVVYRLSSRVRGRVRDELRQLRAGIGSRAAVAQVLPASVLAISCHVATFWVAAVAVGVTLPPLRLAAIALVVLLAASIPLNIGGWGPREGAAGWAFAVAGLSIASGVAVSTLFGILTMIAVAPGAIFHFVIERTHHERPSVRHAEQRYLARRIS